MSLRFEIHFELHDGTEDYIVISGATIDEIRAAAEREVAKRGGKNPWSRERDYEQT